MIIIHAEFHVRPEAREFFLTETVPLIAGSKLEKGNISYNLYEDVSASNTFMMIEEWKNNQAVDTHNKSPHFTAFIAKSHVLFDQPAVIQRFSAEKQIAD